MLIVVTPPASEIITTNDVKDVLRIAQSDNSENALLGRLIREARSYAETITGYGIGVSTYRLSQFAWPRMNHILLPRPPFVSLASFTWQDTAYVDQTLSASVYTAIAAVPHGRVWLKTGESWPGQALGPAGWAITYTGGFGALAAVPQAVVEGIMQLIAHWYTNREGVVVGVSGLRAAEVPFGIRELFDRASVR